MGRPELADDPRFKTGEGRRTNARVLRDLIGEWVTQFRTVEEALAVLSEARIPCAPVLHPSDVIASPHLAERAFFPPVPHPVAGTVRITASPYHLDGEPVHPRGPAAYRVGEHTREVLREVLGYDDARIAALVGAGVIEAP